MQVKIATICEMKSVGIPSNLIAKVADEMHGAAETPS
jgi:hypothetical protein